MSTGQEVLLKFYSSADMFRNSDELHLIFRFSRYLCRYNQTVSSAILLESFVHQSRIFIVNVGLSTLDRFPQGGLHSSQLDDGRKTGRRKNQVSDRRTRLLL